MSKQFKRIALGHARCVETNKNSCDGPCAKRENNLKQLRWGVQETSKQFKTIILSVCDTRKQFPRTYSPEEVCVSTCKTIKNNLKHVKTI